jgi:hypothetical protein
MDLQNIALTLKAQRDNLDRVGNELASFRQKILNSAMAITTEDINTLDLLRSSIMGAVGSLEASASQVEQSAQAQQIQSLLAPLAPEVLTSDEDALSPHQLPLDEETAIMETEETASSPELSSKEAIGDTPTTATTKVTSAKK